MAIAILPIVSIHHANLHFTMERPERPSRHSKSHDKWKRIIHPAVDSDSSSDWSTDSNEASTSASARGKRPWYPVGSQQPGPSTSSDYQPPNEPAPKRKLYTSPEYSNFMSRYAGKRSASTSDTPDNLLNYHLLHHDYAERGSYRRDANLDLNRIFGISNDDVASSSENTAWFLRPAERKRHRTEPAEEPAAPPAASEAADDHDHRSYLDSRMFSWKRLTSKMFAPVEREEVPDVQVISMAGPSARPKKEGNPEEVIILEDAQPASAQQLPAVLVSAARQDEESLNQNLIGLLECPVCMEYMSPPIHQCRRGHLVCVNCKPKLPLCPTCRSRLTDSRNLAMEKVADKLLYPCKNASDGCTEHLRLKDKSLHENDCDYRTYRCSLPLCEWKGLREELLPHYITAHQDDLLYGDQQELLLQLGDLTATTNQNWMISAHGELFRANFISMSAAPRLQLFEPGAARAQLFGCVQYVGPRSRSAQFTYTLTIKQTDGNHRCVCFSRATHTDLVNCSTNYSSGDAFYLRGDTAELLGQGSAGNLMLRVQLSLQPSAAE